MEQQELIPNLFRTEYRKIVSVLCYLFGMDHIETAEDIVSDTFLAATESWSVNGNPENPTAWLYTVAKNKTKNYLKRNTLFEQKLSKEIQLNTSSTEEIEIDLSVKNINDSQLAMIFAVCESSISTESQIALALNLLCGFGIQEIADAFLTNKEVIYKRLNRAKEKLRKEKLKIQQPTLSQIEDRLPTVLTTLYLLFSEGYYSVSHDTVLRKNLCFEAMRLTILLIDNEKTNLPDVNALHALMCFHSSRFEARVNENGESVLYHQQNEMLWDQKLIDDGIHYLNQASTGNNVTKYHLEAGIAFWHTKKEDTVEKWESILQLYNQLLQLEYSPIAALNRTFALSKANGKKEAIEEAEKLQLVDNHFYYSLLGNLYTDIDNHKALSQFELALELATTAADKKTISNAIQKLQDLL
ncbi:RNA polymerase sigma-70 factor, ECF subfamily [Pedobacter sp. ok626]|uniref:RNA polymerase sigma factor n=1 Tax=Pedobacter sp. ok626 TaxID=1761882 RepID=UPI0008892666|nr:sigma-70 family RNA polymerase sigma factor [Pedobacter sp. ok626]SDL10848.1 RNA polymerase sigma-70 factor, ECF subfamily [Pedobacter sp. ok626]